MLEPLLSFTFAPPAVLHLQPLAAAAVYDATVTWESFANGDYQRSTIEKEVTLLVQQNDSGFALDFRTSASRLTKPEDLESLEEIAVRLAELYAWVVVQATVSGEVVGLLNHEALLQTWNRVAQQLRESTVEDDQVTKVMLDFLDKQLQSPDNFLLSLRHDYLYQTLVPNFYHQPLSGPHMPGRLRQFTNFFDKTPLWFAERVELRPSEMPEQLTLQLHGTLDARQTQLPAVQELIARALQVAAPSGAAVPEHLPPAHFHYEAIYVLEQRTGLPLSVDLSVYARAGQLFNKEYTLVITRR